MSISLLSYEHLESMIAYVDPTAHDFRITISNIRHSMDASCDGGMITIRQWRTLLEMVSVLQSKWTVRNGDVSDAARRTIKIPGSR